MNEVKIGDIRINVYNDHINEAHYTISQGSDAPLDVWQSNMESLVANLEVLVEQNWRKPR